MKPDNSFPRSIAEAALLLVRQTYANYRSSNWSRIAQGRILVSQTALGGYDADSARRQACYLRIVSIVEAYVDVLNREMFDEKLSEGDALVGKLVDEIERASVGSWGDRAGVFKKFHDCKLNKCPSWRLFEAMTFVRNTIAHGLGRLTVRQRTIASLPHRMATVGVNLTDHRLMLTDSNIRQAVDIATAIIWEIDMASRGLNP